MWLISNPRFEVDVGTAVDKKASDGRVAVMCRDVQRRETTLKRPHTARNVFLQYTDLTAPRHASSTFRIENRLIRPVVALHQGAPGQMTWPENPPPWLRPAYCFGLLR